MNFKKVVRIGTIADGYPEAQRDIFASIEMKDGRLSISGVIGPKSNGDAHGSCGQFIIGFKEYDSRGHQSIAGIKPAPGWTADKIKRFFDTWNRWHLNDMKAGSAVQENWLRVNPIPAEEYAYPKSHYDVACARLAAAGLNPDPDGYKYGHAWKRETVPTGVIEFLQSLPETDKRPAWV
jgi:hypothetical protein